MVPGAGHHILQFNSHEKIVVGPILSFSASFFHSFLALTAISFPFFPHFFWTRSSFITTEMQKFCAKQSANFFISLGNYVLKERNRETDSNNDNEAHKARPKGFWKKNAQKEANEL